MHQPSRNRGGPSQYSRFRKTPAPERDASTFARYAHCLKIEAGRLRQSQRMLQVIGSIVVVGCVLGGFVLEGGKIMALWHPTEVLIIIGAALGAFLTSNPPKVSKA